MRRFNNVIELWANKPNKTYQHVLLRWNTYYDFGIYNLNQELTIRFMKAELEVSW